MTPHEIAREVRPHGRPRMTTDARRCATCGHAAHFHRDEGDNECGDVRAVPGGFVVCACTAFVPEERRRVSGERRVREGMYHNRRGLVVGVGTNRDGYITDRRAISSPSEVMRDGDMFPDRRPVGGESLVERVAREVRRGWPKGTGKKAGGILVAERAIEAIASEIESTHPEAARFLRMEAAK